MSHSHCKLVTLPVQVFRWPKGLQGIHMNLNQFSRGLFYKTPFLCFFLHKSWIWRTLGYVMDIFSYCNFYIASKECFWPKKIQISCMGSKVPFWKKFKNWIKTTEYSYSLTTDSKFIAIYQRTTTM
jgi:hypothetical protein